MSPPRPYRGGHAVLDDGLDMGYVEDGAPCGPNMMCSERRCLPVTTFNLSTCPGSSASASRICSHHGVSPSEGFSRLDKQKVGGQQTR